MTGLVKVFSSVLLKRLYAVELHLEGARTCENR
jgi:hypothetical protein